MYCKLLVDAYNTLLQVIHPWNRSYMSLLLLYVLTSNSPMEQVCSGIGDLVLVEGGLLRLLHRGWATSSTSRFMTVKFIWKNFYAVNFTFVEPTRLWITRLEVINVAWSIHFCWWWTSTNSQSSTSGRFSLAVINFSWGLCLVLFSNLMMGDPFTKTSDFTVDLFKDAMVQVMCYWL